MEKLIFENLFYDSIHRSYRFKESCFCLVCGSFIRYMIGSRPEHIKKLTIVKTEIKNEDSFRIFKNEDSLVYTPPTGYRNNNDPGIYSSLSMKLKTLFDENEILIYVNAKVEV